MQACTEHPSSISNVKVQVRIGVVLWIWQTAVQVKPERLLTLSRKRGKETKTHTHPLSNGCHANSTPRPNPRGSHAPLSKCPVSVSTFYHRSVWAQCLGAIPMSFPGKNGGFDAKYPYTESTNRKRPSVSSAPRRAEPEISCHS